LIRFCLVYSFVFSGGIPLAPSSPDKLIETVKEAQSILRLADIVIDGDFFVEVGYML